MHKSIQIVSNQGIECPDVIGNLLWVIACILGDIMENSMVNAKYSINKLPAV